MKFVKSKTFIFFIGIFLYMDKGLTQNVLNVEKIMISSSMKKHILRSPLKKSLRRSDGAIIDAYLYAADEEREQKKLYARFSYGIIDTMITTGHYYIYLYDIKIDAFLPYRTAIYTDFDKTRFSFGDNDDLDALVVLPASKQEKSDVLLVSQFDDTYSNVYEAYGFSENELYLKNYFFVGKERHKQLNGLVSRVIKNNKLKAQIVHNGLPSYMLELGLYLSEKEGEITVELLNNLPEEAEPFDY